MAPNLSLQFALVTIALVLVLLGIAISARRVQREIVLGRYERRLGALRPRVLRLLSDDEPDLTSLDGLAKADANLMEELVWSLLPKVRGASRTALVEWLERSGAIETAQRLTRSRSAVRRALAAEHLGAAGLAGTFDEVTSLLADKNDEVRIVATRALGKLGDPRAVSDLLDVLDTPRTVPESFVSMALLHIGPAAIEPLIDGLTSTSSSVRAVCADLLGLHGALKACNRLTVMAETDPVDAVRCRAAAALGRLGLGQGVGALSRCLSPHQPRSLRSEAARALGFIGGRDALASLQIALDDTDEVVGDAAGSALVQLGPLGADVLSLAAASTGVGARRAQDHLARSLVEVNVKRRRMRGLATTGAEHNE